MNSLQKLMAVTGLVFIMIGLYLELSSRIEALERPVASPAATKPSPTSNTQKITAENMFNAINDYRESLGLPRQTKSEATCKMAEIRLPQVTWDFSHNGLQEEVEKWPPGTTFGENLVKDEITVWGAMYAWHNSPAHEAGLKKDFPHLCVATDGNTVVAIWSNK